MRNEREVWRSAARDARLTDEELELVAAACSAGEDLEEDLTVLLAMLQANLSGSFLREFVDRLDRYELAAAELSVVPALHEAMVGIWLDDPEDEDGG